MSLQNKNILQLSMKLFISLFIILNILTILFMNCPVFVQNAFQQTLKSYQSPDIEYKLNLIGWQIAGYAHFVGLDNRWQMFGRQTRFNWWYVIKAKYDNLKEVVLPLSGQEPRSFLRKEFIDFKEAKFYLNIYTRAFQRETYARYLCRQFPTNENSRINSIIYELHWQNILPPDQAKLTGMVLHPGLYSQILNEFKCPDNSKETN